MWRTSGTRFLPENLARSRRSGRVTVAMWGWFSFHGVGELLDVPERLNGREYIRILDALVWPARVKQFPEPDPLYIVHDRSPIHT